MMRCDRGEGACGSASDGVWLRRVVRLGLATVLCVAITSCSTSGWNTPHARAFREELVGVMRQAVVGEPALRSDAGRIEAVLPALARRPPEYDPEHDVYYWRDETCTLEFGLRVGRGGGGAPPPPEGWRPGDVRALGLMYRAPEGAGMWRVVLFPERIELHRVGPTSLYREEGGTRRARGKLGVRSIVEEIVRQEEDFWASSDARDALLRVMAREIGETDPDSAHFEWSAGECRAEADCVYVASAVGGSAEAAAAGYIVNEVRLVTMDKGRPVRMLVLRPQERVLVRYGPTPLKTPRRGE